MLLGVVRVTVAGVPSLAAAAVGAGAVAVCDAEVWWLGEAVE